MSERVQCSEASCPNKCKRWRSCPFTQCPAEIARCAEHGGDVVAVEEMRRHIETHTVKEFVK